MKNRLQEVLKQRGLRQDWIAEKASIHPTTMSRIVTGKGVPSLEVAFKIAKVLELQVDELWSYEED